MKMQIALPLLSPHIFVLYFLWPKFSHPFLLFQPVLRPHTLHPYRETPPTCCPLGEWECVFIHLYGCGGVRRPARTKDREWGARRVKRVSKTERDRERGEGEGDLKVLPFFRNINEGAAHSQGTEWHGDKQKPRDRHKQKERHRRKTKQSQDRRSEKLRAKDQK